MTKPSTLQRSAMRPEKGQFEANFAVNLDFSGVDDARSVAHHDGTSTNVDTRTTSHSAALLQLKQAEAAQKLRNEQQEAILQEMAQKRQEKLNGIEQQSRSQKDLPTFLAPAGATKRGNDRSSNASIGALVVGMHNAERKDEPKQKLLRGRARDSNKRKSQHGQSSSSASTITTTPIRTTRQHFSAKARPRRKPGGGKKVAARKSNHHRSKY